MEPLDVAQKIKLIKLANLTVPVIRAPTDEYDIEKPTKFDKYVQREDIQVTSVINALLGIITFLSKELILSNAVIPRDLWIKLRQVRALVKSQKHTQL